jgi:hypothetical protein
MGANGFWAVFTILNREKPRSRETPYSEVGGERALLIAPRLVDEPGEEFYPGLNLSTKACAYPLRGHTLSVLIADRHLDPQRADVAGLAADEPEDDEGQATQFFVRESELSVCATPKRSCRGWRVRRLIVFPRD